MACEGSSEGSCAACDQDIFILEHKSFDGTMYPSKLVYEVNNDWLSLNIEKLQPDVSLDDSIFLRSSNK